MNCDSNQDIQATQSRSLGIIENDNSSARGDEVSMDENIEAEAARSLEIKETGGTGAGDSQPVEKKMAQNLNISKDNDETGACEERTVSKEGAQNLENHNETGEPRTCEELPREKNMLPEVAQSLEIDKETGATDNIIIKSNIYNKLLEMESWALVPNTVNFECEVCMEPCKAYSGVVLRECLHSFCRPCLLATVQHCEEPTIMCPANDCSGTLLESEIRTLVTEKEFKRWLDRGLLAAEKSSLQTFHCCMHDCVGWAYCDPDVNNFPCPVCGRVSCVPCKAIHEGESCDEYQQTSGDVDVGSLVMLQNLIASGEAMNCPECRVVIMKITGCDWVRCSACRTEICWITQGYRWGPMGRGDTSGGCRCRQGKRCHPLCGNCH